MTHRSYGLTVYVAVLVFLFLPSISSGALTHKVSRGDTLYSISKKYKVSVSEIKASNGLRSSSIKPGLVLDIPGSREQASIRPAKTQTAKTASSPNAAPVSAKQTGVHTVKSGDTLYAIARVYGASVKELKKLNGLKGSSLRAGRDLKVPIREQGEPEVREVAAPPSPAPAVAAPVASAAVTEAYTMMAVGLGDTEVAKSAKAVRATEVVSMNGNDGSGVIDDLLGVAQNFLGVPYRFGGVTEKGIDCSAFVQKVFGFLSVDLPRTAREQFKVGKQVAKTELKEGDLVFFKTYSKRFPSHVGIYMGDNKFIHASSRGKQVSISNFNEPYYVKRFIGAKRLEMTSSY